MEDHNNNGWSEWKNHVLAEIGRLDERLEAHTESDATNFKELRTLIEAGVDKISIEVATLKAKAGVWGVVGGIVVAIGVELLGK